MIKKFFKILEHPQIQEVVGVAFAIMLIFHVIQGRYINVAIDIVMIFCSVKLIEVGNKK